jgi:hypothetical protein
MDKGGRAVVRGAWITLAALLCCASFGGEPKGKAAASSRPTADQLGVSTQGANPVGTGGGETLNCDAIPLSGNGHFVAHCTYTDPPSDWWVRVLSALTLITIGWQGYLFFRQTEIVRGQSALARSQARAFVFLDRIVPEITTEADRLDTTNPLDPVFSGLRVLYFGIQPIWKNSGTTPVTAMVRVNRDFVEGDLPANYDYPYNKFEQPIFLGPQSTSAGDVIETNPNMANECIFGKKSMFVWGVANYVDDYGENHFAQWCCRVRFSRVQGKVVTAQFIQWGPHNRSDQ